MIHTNKTLDALTNLDVNQLVHYYYDSYGSGEMDIGIPDFCTDANLIMPICWEHGIEIKVAAAIGVKIQSWRASDYFGKVITYTNRSQLRLACHAYILLMQENSK